MTDTHEKLREVELLPCPFCGTDDRLYVYSPFDDDAETVVVTCNQCNAEGPYYGGSDSTTPEIAKALWNDRALTADRFTLLLEKAEAAIDRRVAEERARLLEKLRDPSDKMLDAACEVEGTTRPNPGAVLIWQAMLTAFEQENDE